MADDPGTKPEWRMRPGLLVALLLATLLSLWLTVRVIEVGRSAIGGP